MASATEAYLSDYTPPDFLVDAVALDIDIRRGRTTVTSRLDLRRNPSGKKNAPLFLNGENQNFLGVTLNGKNLPRPITGSMNTASPSPVFRTRQCWK